MWPGPHAGLLGNETVTACDVPVAERGGTDVSTPMPAPFRPGDVGPHTIESGDRLDGRYLMLETVGHGGSVISKLVVHEVCPVVTQLLGQSTAGTVAVTVVVAV